MLINLVNGVFQEFCILLNFLSTYLNNYIDNEVLKSPTVVVELSISYSGLSVSSSCILKPCYYVHEHLGLSHPLN